MNIANLSPAERMKAFGLVGVIIVILFFVVHTLLGAVAPKKQSTGSGQSAAAGGQSVAQSPSGIAPSPAGGAANPAGGAANSGSGAGAGDVDAFPVDKAFASAKKVGDLERNVPDPFVQIRETENSGVARDAKFKNSGAPFGGGRPFEEPKVVIHSEPLGGVPHGGLPALGSVPLMGGGGPAPLVLAPVEPEIKVVGIVHGDSPVATLSVGGQIQQARPGDELAKGWRLKQVTEEGVVVRHKGELLSWRVGAVANSPAPK